MPSKRTLAILLILAGLFAIGGVIYWMFFAPGKISFPTAPAAPSQTQPAPVSPPIQPATPQTPPTTLPRTTNSDDQDQLLLRQKALVFAARQGSYSNSDGFASMNDVYIDANPVVQAFYKGEVQRLMTEHPLNKGSWTQTTRALSSRITSDLPLTGKTQAVVVVQAQQIIETSAQPAQISYREITIQFTNTSKGWIVSRVDSVPLAL